MSHLLEVQWNIDRGLDAEAAKAAAYRYTYSADLRLMPVVYQHVRKQSLPLVCASESRTCMPLLLHDMRSFILVCRCVSGQANVHGTEQVCSTMWVCCHRVLLIVSPSESRTVLTPCIACEGPRRREQRCSACDGAGAVSRSCRPLARQRSCGRGGACDLQCSSRLQENVHVLVSAVASFDVFALPQRQVHQRRTPRSSPRGFAV